MGLLLEQPERKGARREQPKSCRLICTYGKKQITCNSARRAGEVGRNMWVLEQNDEILVLDCGVMFPEADMLGVDLVLPDITYLRDQKDKIKAIVLTHGHEDHMGAVPYLRRNSIFHRSTVRR